MKKLYLFTGVLIIALLAGCGGKTKNTGSAKSDSSKQSANAICETIPQSKAQADTLSSRKTAARDTAKVKISKTESQEKKTTQVISKPKNLPRLWDFGAENCIPCKTMMGILNPMMQEFTGKVDIRIINVYKEQALANQYHIQVIPTQVFMDTTGQEFYRHVGVLLRDSILSKFTEFGFTK
jgi:thioredoxin 1